MSFFRGLEGMELHFHVTDRYFTAALSGPLQVRRHLAATVLPGMAAGRRED